jgi:hypothetical protein
LLFIFLIEVAAHSLSYRDSVFWRGKLNTWPRDIV